MPAEPKLVAPPEPGAIDLGQAGASAQAEFARRHDKREATIRSAHPRIGGLILALTDDPQPTRAWASGAAGERRFGAAMSELGDAVIALHDRRVPRSRANIDHIVVGPSGVFVVDAKRYKDASINIRRSGGLFSPVREQLMVSGRDKTKLVEAMSWQVDAFERHCPTHLSPPRPVSSPRCASSTADSLCSGHCRSVASRSRACPASPDGSPATGR